MEDCWEEDTATCDIGGRYKSKATSESDRIDNLIIKFEREDILSSFRVIATGREEGPLDLVKGVAKLGGRRLATVLSLALPFCPMRMVLPLTSYPIPNTTALMNFIL